MEGVLRRRLLHDAGSSADLPKVGDWVVFEKMPGEQKGAIELVLPRYSKVSRKTAHGNEEQVVATNVDVMFIVQSLDQDFSIPRLQRYVITAEESNIQPVILLNKADAAEDPYKYLDQVKLSFPQVITLLISAKTGQGMDQILGQLGPAMTVVVVGSSGVGKSSLINTLMQNLNLATGAVRESDSKGRHTTTRREMVKLSSGAILIDTPGVREFGLWAEEVSTETVNSSFAAIDELTAKCKYRDCDHEKTEGCAVKAAVEEEVVSQELYRSFIKLKREAEFRESKESFEVQRARKEKEKKRNKDLKEILKRKKR
jgi:ribosome biogenesis GTPase / thiamine phosphate phosphatase